MKPAVFLDRDGVVAVEKGYVCSLGELELFDYAKESIRQIKEMGFYVFIVSNQSAVARGLLLDDELCEINRYLKQELEVAQIYSCPHYEKGIIPRYSIKCDCRKPAIGMLRLAMREFDIDIKNSYMVGDRASDIEFGGRAGMKTILVRTGYGSRELEYDVKPDYVIEDLRGVVGIIKEAGK